jgi:very-short-patch-repair endonuclease
MIDESALAAEFSSRRGVSTRARIHTVVEVCGRAWHPARPGSCALARVLRSRPAWLKPVRSSYERRLERALLESGFPTLVREHPVVLLDGGVVHPDLGIPQARFFIEVDHPTWHGGLDNAYDRARDLEVERAGNCVKRVPTRSIDERLDDTVALLVDLRNRRLGSVDASSPGPR